MASRKKLHFPPSDKIKLKVKKLGREKADARVFPDSLIIEVDPRLKGKRRLEVLIHELYHLGRFPRDNETLEKEEHEVTKVSEFLAENLWRFGVRCVIE